MHTAENHSDRTQMKMMTTAVQNPQIAKNTKCTEPTEVEQGWKATGDCNRARPRATAVPMRNRAPINAAQKIG